MEYRPALLSKLGKPFSAESMQEMWRMALDVLRDPVFLHDKDGRIIRANRAYANLAGLAFADFIGQPYWRVFPKAEGPSGSCRLAIADPSLSEVDETVEVDGNLYIARSIPLADSRGEYLYSLHVMEDITPLRGVAGIVSQGKDRFCLVSESIDEAFWIADITLDRFYYANRGYERLWGVPRGDLYRHPRRFAEAIHPDDRERVLADFIAQKAGQAFEHECRLLRPDGSLRWVLNRGFPLADDTGVHSRHLGIAVDITAQKQMEYRLAESEKTYREIFDKAADAILVHDSATDEVTDANRAFSQLFGYGRDELPGLTIARLSAHGGEATTQALIRRYVEQALATGSHRFEWPARRKDGSEFWCEVNLTTAEIMAKPHMLASVRDISDRKRMEEALRRSEEKQRLLFESSRDALMLLAPPSWRFTDGNQATVRLFGVSSVEEFTKLGPWDVSPALQPDGRASAEKAREMIATAMREGSHFFEWEHRKLNGPPFAADVLLTRMQVGDELFLHATVRDISERKRAEEQLRQINQTLEERVAEATRKNMEQERILTHQARHAAMGQMISNIAHQWRQPLAALGLIVQNLHYDFQEGSLGEKELEAYVGKAMRAIERMSATIDEFRDFLQPSLQATSFSVVGIIGESLELLSAGLGNHGFEASVAGSPEIELFGYPGEFSQAILNLIANAKDALLERKIAGGRIEIAVAETDSEVVVSLRDNAGGIAPEHLEMIFDPYFTTKESGTGIGLYITRVIVEQHFHGTIVAENRDQGTEFRLMFPLPAKSPAPDSPPR